MNITLKKALEYYQNKEFDSSKKICIEILDNDPKNFDANNLLAAIFFQNSEYLNAIKFFKNAITINPKIPDLYNNLSIAFCQIKKFDEALASWNKAIRIKPDYAEAYFGKGNIYSIFKDYDKAIDNYYKAIQINKNFKQAYNNLGNIYFLNKKFKKSLENFVLASNIKPVNEIEINNQGNIFFELRDYKLALEKYSYATNINPKFALGFYNIAKTYEELNQSDDAIINYQKAIQLNSNFAEAHQNLGNLYLDLEIFEKGIFNLTEALRINPGLKNLHGTIIQSKCGMCDWSTFVDDKNLLEKNILMKKNTSNPFPVISIYDSPELQRIASETYVKDEFSNYERKEIIKKNIAPKKIKIGYFSSDFHNHATSHLMINLFELHDRSKFEVYAFSFGKDDNSDMRERISKAFDKFFDVRLKSEEEIAKKSRELEIDIAVDLKGYTGNNRFGIFIERCAPIQISYLGYPGTTGSPYIDYLVADKTLIPNKNKKFYSEKIIYLPNSYQVNEDKKIISKKNFTRKDFGLPDDSFVYCSFNQIYKILPEMLKIWANILTEVKNSVLWLLADNDKAKTNILSEFLKVGVNSSRVIFTKRLSLDEHFERQKLADLFLDTYPCNAHTTASDALRVGLPLLTLKGQSFASRVSTSLLKELEMEELITNNYEEYTIRAIELAKDKELINNIKVKLQKNVKSKTLFKAETFTKYLEISYQKVYELYLRDMQPDHIEVQ